jgi:peptide/nickel transport system substrate-binding protein
MQGRFFRFSAPARAVSRVGIACMTALIALAAPVPASVTHDRVRYALIGEPISLNPLFLQGSNLVMMSELAFEPLLRFGAHGRLIPALATAAPTRENGGISPEGRRITVHLRAGTLWADGVPVTSADVKFTVDAYLNPANANNLHSGFAQIRTMHLPDAQTIIFDLVRPDPTAYGSIVALTPLPKHLLGAYPDLNHVAYNLLPVGNGPYNVVEWKHGDVIRLQANPRYWRGRPSVPRIDLEIVPSATTAMLELKTHELDLVSVLPSEVDRVPVGGVARYQSPSLSWNQILFNYANPAFSDARVRRAIMLAIDREKLATVAGHGLYTTDRILLPIFQWALDPTVLWPKFDAAAASRLLDAAGWNVAPDGVRRKGNQALSFELVYLAGGDAVLPTIVAADLAQIHIHVDQRSVQSGLLLNTAAAGGILATGKFDLALISLQTNPDPDISWLFACDQRPPVGFNPSKYCDPALDADFNAERSTFDRARRMSALASVQRRLSKDVAFVPLYRVDRLWVGADWLHGLQPSPYSPFWNVFAWTVGDPTVRK